MRLLRNEKKFLLLVVLLFITSFIGVLSLIALSYVQKVETIKIDAARRQTVLAYKYVWSVVSDKETGDLEKVKKEFEKNLSLLKNGGWVPVSPDGFVFLPVPPEKDPAIKPALSRLERLWRKLASTVSYGKKAAKGVVRTGKKLLAEVSRVSFLIKKRADFRLRIFLTVQTILLIGLSVFSLFFYFKFSTFLRRTVKQVSETSEELESASSKLEYTASKIKEASQSAFSFLNSALDRLSHKSDLIYSLEKIRDSFQEATFSWRHLELLKEHLHRRAEELYELLRRLKG